VSGFSPAGAMAGFAAHLRLNGVAAGAAETCCALDALGALAGPPTVDGARAMLRMVFAGDRAEWERFGELFDSYWLAQGTRVAQPAEGVSQTARQVWGPAAGAEHGGEPRAGAEAGGDAPAGPEGARRDAARGGRQSAPDPALLSGQSERERILLLGARVARALRHRRSPRTRPARRGFGLHFRRTLRRSLATGGEPIGLYRRRRRGAAARISALLDVSGSMRERCGFFLTFLRGLAAGGPHPESFIFHTRLIRVTSAFAARSAQQATEKFALQSQGIGGGTRIAASLREFARLYGKECLGRRSAAIVISDGYDTDPPEELEAALKELRRHTPRIIWVSPSLGEADRSRPRARALAAALPHLDLLAPVRDASDLERLEEELAAL